MQVLLVDPSPQTAAALPGATRVSFAELGALHARRRVPASMMVCIEGEPSEDHLRWLREVFPETPRLGRTEGAGRSTLHHQLGPEEDWQSLIERARLLGELLGDPRLRRFRLDTLPTLTPVFTALRDEVEPEAVVTAIDAQPDLADRLCSLARRVTEHVSAVRDALLYLGVPTTLRLLLLAEQGVEKLKKGGDIARVETPTPTRPVLINNGARVTEALRHLLNVGEVQVIADNPRGSWNARLRRVEGGLELSLPEARTLPSQGLRMVGLVGGEIHVAPLEVQRREPSLLRCAAPRTFIRYQRRGHTRREVSLDARLQVGGCETAAQVVDVSLGGLGIVCESTAAQPGDTFSVTLRLSPRHEVDLEVCCKTRREVQGQIRLGTRFTGLTPTQHRLVQRLAG